MSILENDQRELITQSAMAHVENAFFSSIALENPIAAVFFRNAFIQLKKDIENPQNRQDLESKMSCHGLEGIADLEAKMQLYSLDKMFKFLLQGLPTQIDADGIETIKNLMVQPFALYHLEKVIDDCNISPQLGVAFNFLAMTLLQDYSIDSALDDLDKLLKDESVKLPTSLDITQVLGFLSRQYKDQMNQEDLPYINAFMCDPVKTMLRINLLTIAACKNAMLLIADDDPQLGLIAEYSRVGLVLRYKAEYRKYSRFLFPGKSFTVDELAELRKDSILVRYAYGVQALIVASVDIDMKRDIYTNLAEFEQLFDDGAEVVGADNDLGIVLIDSDFLKKSMKRSEMNKEETTRSFFTRLFKLYPNLPIRYPTLWKDLIQSETNMLLDGIAVDVYGIIDNIDYLKARYNRVERRLGASLGRSGGQGRYLKGMVNLFGAMNRALYRHGQDYDTLGKSSPAFYLNVAQNLFYRDPLLYMALVGKALQKKLKWEG